jgi:hypothetical protein
MLHRQFPTNIHNHNRVVTLSLVLKMLIIHLYVELSLVPLLQPKHHLIRPCTKGDPETSLPKDTIAVVRTKAMMGMVYRSMLIGSLRDNQSELRSQESQLVVVGVGRKRGGASVALTCIYRHYFAFNGWFFNGNVIFQCMCKKCSFYCLSFSLEN